MSGLRRLKTASAAQSNGLPITRAAAIDRESSKADTRCQNPPDLVAATRHRVHGHVGRALDLCFILRQHEIVSMSTFLVQRAPYARSSVLRQHSMADTQSIGQQLPSRIRATTRFCTVFVAEQNQA